mgnify:FL=1
MKLLFILFGAFAFALVGTIIFQGEWNFLLSGNIAMALFIIFTGVSHFRFVEGMTMMMPEIVPAKKFMVYFTGILEIAAGVGLLIPSLREITAILLIVFFIVIFPANYKSSKENINIFKADSTGPGMGYFWKERLPMQIILIAWTYFFGIYL